MYTCHYFGENLKRGRLRSGLNHQYLCGFACCSQHLYTTPQNTKGRGLHFEELATQKGLSMYLSIHHAKKIVFGKCDQWGTKDNPRPTDTRTYSLEVFDRHNVCHEFRVYVDDDTIVPVVDSQITDAKNNHIGDWLTDDIGGINLELPPMPDESESPDGKTAKQELAEALSLVLSAKTKLVASGIDERNHERLIKASRALEAIVRVLD